MKLGWRQIVEFSQFASTTIGAVRSENGAKLRENYGELSVLTRLVDYVQVGHACLASRAFDGQERLSHFVLSKAKPMSIRRAVITAAAPDQKSLPLQTLVDQQGCHRSALELIVDEAVAAGIEEVCVVVCPGVSESYCKAAGPHGSRLTFVEQDQPRGYGDALFRAREFASDEPFLHLISDHVFISHNEQACARQIVEMANNEKCIVSAVQETRENMLPYFGTVGATRHANRDDLYEVRKVVEKPTPTFAEQELVVAGLRGSHYLCFSGIHVLTPGIFEQLEQDLSANEGNVPLSPALNAMAQKERYLALRVAGTRYNIGAKYGLLKGQLALALTGKDRDVILTDLLELVSSSRGGR